MPGKYQYDIELKSNVAKLLTDMKEVQDRLDTVEGKEYKIKLNVDEKKLSNVISNLEKMLDSLGKGTGDFKQFENLSKELSSIVSEVQNLSKAFGKVDDSGTKTLLSSIQNIDKSLSELSQHIINVNKNMSNIGGDTNSTVKQVENISNAYDNASKSAEKLVEAQSKIGNKSNISSENITNQIVENEKKKQEAYKATADAVMYHAGVVSKLNKAETNGRFYGSDRGTGYFGTGHYFVDSATKHELDNNSSYSKLPYTSIDISQYDNLFKATTNEIADGLHTFLKNLTKFTQGSDSFSVSELFSQFQKVFGETVMDMQEFDAKLEQLKTYMQNSNMSDRGDSVSTQFMKSLGYGGVDTRGTKYADTRYGTVIYDLKEESILQANITDELQKQGQMLEKINYEKGQVFDKSEDTRIQGILDQQAKSKEIDAEFNKLYDSTQLKVYESELDSVNNKLKENDNIISECSSAITNADEGAKQFAKEMKALGLEMSQEEIANTANQNRESYQTRIDELEKERPLLEARKQELEQNLQTEYELANAARERAKAIVEERNSPIKDVFQGDDKATTDASITAIKGESQALEQVSTSAKDAATSKEKFANANKEVKASAEETVISVDKEISALEKAGSRFESQAAGLAIKPDDQHQFSSWKKQLEDLNIEIAEYKSKVENLSKIDIADEEQIKKAKTEVENLGNSIKETITAMSKTSQSKRGWTDIGASKAAEKVANVLKQNTKMSKEARDAIRAYYNELRSGNPSQPIDEILVKVNQLVQKERELGRVGKSFGEIFKEKVIYGGAAQLAGMVGFYDVINVGREIVTNIKEVDTALTELRKVSDATEQRLTANFKNSADTAKELGATISDVISATADWSRMGYNIDQAEELARVSTLYKNVGDGIDIETANNSLISTLQGFQLDASEAESIIDKFNEVANNYAIDSAGIGEALQRSAASFNAANTDLSKSIALITATNEVVQDPDSVGTLWKTMSARIRGAETELEELGEETDEYTKTTSKLRDLIQSLTGFDIMIDEDTFKDVYEIILGIGKEWDNLTDVEQSSLGEALAGKRNANALYAVLGNLDTLQSAYETAEESAGKQNYLNI